MNTSKYIKQIVGLSFLIFTLSSCFDMELVGKGEITLTTDWSQKDQSVNIPVSYAVKVNNQLLNFNSPSNPLPDLYPNHYPIWIYNRPEHIHIEGGKAYVSQENGILNTLPGWLFTAFGEVSYENNTVKDLTIKMVQQVRQLQIKLTPTGGAASQVNHIQAALSGIAGTWNFEKEIPEGNSLTIPLIFAKQQDGSWTANVRILGIISNQQKLIGEISFDQGHPKEIQFESDLSASLVDFNKNKHVPKTLAAEVETKTEAGFTITVNEWEEVQESGSAW